MFRCFLTISLQYESTVGVRYFMGTQIKKRLEFKSQILLVSLILTPQIILQCRERIIQGNIGERFYEDLENSGNFCALINGDTWSSITISIMNMKTA